MKLFSFFMSKFSEIQKKLRNGTSFARNRIEKRVAKRFVTATKIKLVLIRISPPLKVVIVRGSSIHR